MESPEVRRRTMQAVKSEDTAPELTVRCLAHGMGYRFRLHRKDLPAKPDPVFPRLHKVVFVHGCFCHGHDCARGARTPVRNRAYWMKKVERNRERGENAQASLKKLGWGVLVVWECELKNRGAVGSRVKGFLARVGGL